MAGGFLRLVASATLLTALSTVAVAQKVDSQKINNLKSQQTSLENRIADLQAQVDDAYAGKSYCSADERQEDLSKLRDLRRQIAQLRTEYGNFKRGFIKLAATPTAGPQFDAAGIHPDERSYWNSDDRALQKLDSSSLAKAMVVEQAAIRDCSEKKAPATSLPPPQTTPSSAPPATRAETAPKTSPVTAQVQPPPRASPPPGGCTENEGTERRLRIQDEILKLEEELIPLDGTTPEGRARQTQLIGEIDRLGKMLNMPCPPLLPPLPPKPMLKVTPPTTAIPPESGPPVRPHQITGLIYLNPLAKLEDEADDALDDLDDAMDDCDEEAVKALIPLLEKLSEEAHAAASAASAAGEFSTISASEAQSMAEDLDHAIAAAKKLRCLTRPAKRLRLVPMWLSPMDQRLLYLHNSEREAVHAAPLKWNFKLEWDATGYAHEMAITHQLIHAPREGRGIERENLQQTMIGWGPDRMLQNWIFEKRDFRAGYYPNVAIDGNWLNVSHYTQIIWPTTTDLGCGYAEGGGFGWLVCRYSPGGNKDGKPVGLPYMPERG